MAKQFETITINIMIPIILRNRKKAPGRCARNLVELGESIKKHASEDKEDIIECLSILCTGEDEKPIMDFFNHIYLSR